MFHRRKISIYFASGKICFNRLKMVITLNISETICLESHLTKSVVKLHYFDVVSYFYFNTPMLSMVQHGINKTILMYSYFKKRTLPNKAISLFSKILNQYSNTVVLQNDPNSLEEHYILYKRF